MTPAGQNARHLPRVLRFFDISVLSSASMGPAYSLASTMGPMVAAAGAVGGVAAPFVGLLTLRGVMTATIAFEDRFLAYIALAGVCMGVPLSLWRGAAVGKAAGYLPGHCEPTALAPPL